MAKIITSEADVPVGWVRMADLADNSTDAKILSDAHNSGTLAAVKLVENTRDFRFVTMNDDGEQMMLAKRKRLALPAKEKARRFQFNARSSVCH